MNRKWVGLRWPYFLISQAVVCAALVCSVLAIGAIVFAQQPGSAQSDAPQLQQPPQAPKIAVDVKTVNILATVRDKHGKIVPDLDKNAFQLTEDGHAQAIDYFARESDLPLRLVLLVDTSLSQRRVLEQERNASYSFLDKLLRPEKDLAGLINFDFDITLLQDFTASRPKLQAALQHLETPQLNRVQDPSQDPGSRDGGHQRGGGYGRHGGGTHLYDAIYLASDELMSKQQGRKALIILSDGVDHGSKETLGEAIETAQRPDTVIYSILFSDDQQNEHHGFGVGGPYGGHGGYGGRGGGRYPQQAHTDGKKILEQASKMTGGRLFEASKKESIDQIYAQIDEELRNQYRLGYTPAKNLEAGYHRIQLTTTNKDLKVQARDGYYSGGQSVGASTSASSSR